MNIILSNDRHISEQGLISLKKLYSLSQNDNSRPISEQGLISLKKLYSHAQSDTGQAHIVARFLACLYNGYDFQFDLTDFRALDQDLFVHCLNVLILDHRCVKEVHEYFDNGGKRWETMIEYHGLRRKPADL